MKHLLRFMILVALLAMMGGLSPHLQAQPLTTPVQTQPDCLVFFDLTLAPSNGATFDNRFIGCDSWTVSYTNTGFTVLSLIFQNAPDANGIAGAFVTFAGLPLISGINPNTAITQASSNFKGYYPWLRVRLDAATGAGRVRGVMYGYRSQPTAYVLFGPAAAITANQGTANTQANRWPVFLSDGANATGTAGNPLRVDPTGTTAQPVNQGAAAVAANRWPMYLSNATGDIACTNSAAISLPGIGTTQIVALSAGQRIRVCNVSLTLSGSSTLTFIEGTGAACVTGPANLSGAYPSVLSLSLFSPLSPLVGSTSQALCITLGSAVTGGGTIIYSLQ